MEWPALCAFRDILRRFSPPALAVRMDLADSLPQRATALTVSDVASLLNISQVYKLAADGRIPCFKIGNSVRFDPAPFAAWLRQKMGPVSADAQFPLRCGPMTQSQMSNQIPHFVIDTVIFRGKQRRTRFWTPEIAFIDIAVNGDERPDGFGEKTNSAASCTNSPRKKYGPILVLPPSALFGT